MTTAVFTHELESGGVVRENTNVRVNRTLNGHFPARSFLLNPYAYTAGV